MRAKQAVRVGDNNGVVASSEQVQPDPTSAVYAGTRRSLRKRKRGLRYPWRVSSTMYTTMTISAETRLTECRKRAHSVFGGFFDKHASSPMHCRWLLCVSFRPQYIMHVSGPSFASTLVRVVDVLFEYS